MIDFIKRNKMLAFVFVICIYLMIKNSSIPYFFDPPFIISFLFDSPKSEFFSKLAPLVDMFTSAYVTSLIFYIFIEYVPAIRQEKNAKAILKPQLVNLHYYITELLSMIEYSAKSEKLLPTDNIADLDNLSIKNKDFFVIYKLLKMMRI